VAKAKSRDHEDSSTKVQEPASIQLGAVLPRKGPLQGKGKVIIKKSKNYDVEHAVVLVKIG